MRYSTRLFDRRWLRLFTILFLLAATSAFACQVPVFRYALERWPSDRYEILILHDEPLSKLDQARVDKLRDPRHAAFAIANIDTQVIHVGNSPGDNSGELILALWKEHSKDGKPIMAVLYPRNAQEVPDRVADVLPFTDAAIGGLVDSPIRQSVSEKLLDGESAVWIFVPSGHADQDATALRVLTEQVKLNQEQLELPPQEEIEEDEFYQPETNIELRIGFSIVTLRRDDPKEQFLLNLLLGSESDLEALDEPMAFPVLGRGRVLYALVGKGIMAETIGMASQFIIGPCSCQVKEQNPGFDLLLAVDWDKAIGRTTLSQPLPTLSSEPVLLPIPPGKSTR